MFRTHVLRNLCLEILEHARCFIPQLSAPGLVKFITAVAYHFYPSLPAAFTQPGALTLTGLCISKYVIIHWGSGMPKTPLMTIGLPV